MSETRPEPYDIAHWLTEDARRAAARAEYMSKLDPARRDSAGRCPLGIALRKMGCDTTVGAPNPEAVADALIIAGLAHVEEHAAISLAAAEFENPWDDGLITDLAAALGVEAP